MSRTAFRCTQADMKLTVQMVVLLAVGVGERVQFSQQKRVFQHSLDGFDKERLQRGRMLLFGVALV